MARSNKKKTNRGRTNGRVIRIREEQHKELQQPRKSYVSLIPRNIAQEEYVANLHDQSQRIVFATGPAGTGKTYLAVQKAVQEFMDGNSSHIVVTRPAVTVDENHGFLPGDINKKMEPWTRPIFDVFEEYYSPKDIKLMIEEGTIEICPLAFMRGRTFKNCTIIFDESQNTTISQMKMALTRIGEGTRMFVTGDINQSDLGGTNGLHDFFEKLTARVSDTISLTHFSRNDIERDPIVEEVLRFYGED
jgi:phosphate starvation-inducible PhoH-like protein